MLDVWIEWFRDEIVGIIFYFQLAALLIGTLRFRHLSLGQKFLWGVVLLGIVTDRVSIWVSKAELMETNVPLLNFNTIGEFLILVSVYYFGVKGLLSEKQYRLILGIFLIIALINMLIFQGFWNYNSITRSLESIIIVLLTFQYFRFTLDHLSTPNLSKSFSFWFASAVLLYFVANLLMFFYMHVIYENSLKSEADKQSFLLIWSIFNFTNLILYSFYAIAFLCKEPKASPKYSWSAP